MNNELVTSKDDEVFIEEVLSYTRILERAFDYVLKEQSTHARKERNLWNKYVAEAKKQYPNFDFSSNGTHYVFYDWVTKKMCVSENKNKEFIE